MCVCSGLAVESHLQSADGRPGTTAAADAALLTSSGFSIPLATAGKRMVLVLEVRCR